MLAAQIFEVFRARVPWSVMKVLLGACNIPVSSGWETTFKKILHDGKIKDEFAESFELLKDYYLKYILIGEKSVRGYKISRNEIDVVIDFFKLLKVEENIFHETYPFSLSSERLGSAESKSKLVEVKEMDNKVFLVFCTKRHFTERITINTNTLNSVVKDGLGNYDEIIGIRKYAKQFFDVVVLWTTKDLVEVRIDVASGMLDKERFRSFLEIVSAFNNIVRGKFNNRNFLVDDNSINSFPLIDLLYQSKEGRVVELSFLTDEGSVKHEKMKKKGDLREELYHKAGKQAVHHINSFRLAIIWKSIILDKLETQPEILLPGSSRLISHSSPRLDEIILSGCSTLEDYDFIFSKIIDYLGIS
jgi:hypothetical protein